MLIEIETSRVINTDAIDFELEWLGEGLRSYSALETIRKQFNIDNKITSITKLPGLPIIAVGDEIGTIRFFNNPNTGSDIYYHRYAEHLYSITSCQFTHDRRYLISMSSYDRCIFKWKCNFNEKKIKEIY
jgi:WD40 repeat protein